MILMLFANLYSTHSERNALSNTAVCDNPVFGFYANKVI